MPVTHRMTAIKCHHHPFGWQLCRPGFRWAAVSALGKVLSNVTSSESDFHILIIAALESHIAAATARKRRAKNKRVIYRLLRWKQFAT